MPASPRLLSVNPGSQLAALLEILWHLQEVEPAVAVDLEAL